MSTSKWKPYPINKPLKLGSVKEIPSNWDLVKIKHVVNNLVSGGTPDSGNDDFWSDDDTGIPWVSISDMSTVDFVDTTVKRITNLGLEAKRLPILRKGTIIYSIYASIGKVSVLNIDATVNQAILGLNGLVETDTDFLVYWLRHLEESISLYSSSNTQLNLNADIVGNLPVLRPPLMEQKAISKFLNKKTLDISNSINYFETQLGLLKEKRSALITQAVTKGLNQDVSMKDSGIQWIGEIPNHWGVTRLGWHCTMIVPMRDKPTSLEGDIPWIRIEDFDGKFIGKSKSGQGVSRDLASKMNLKIYPIGTVLCTASCNLGTTAITTVPLITNQTFIGIETNNDIDSNYLYYFMNAASEHLQNLSSGAIQQYLSRDDFKAIKIPYLNFAEQQRIASYIDKNVNQIDSLVQKTKAQIDNLKQYRIALISATVTGKIDVREMEV